MEFHISRQARQRFQFDQALFSLSGNVLFADFQASRLFAQKINQHLDLVRYPELAVKAGQINAMGLIDEILHFIIQLYRQQRNPGVMQEALVWLQNKLGEREVERLLVEFVARFPPSAVYQSRETPESYLKGETGGIANRLAALEEMLMLWVANQNPAHQPYLFLFSDNDLASSTVYAAAMQNLHTFFENQPHFGPDELNLVDMLRSPAIAAPNSLYSQLDYIRERWMTLLGQYLYRLLISLDQIKEEEKSAMQVSGVVAIPLYDQAAEMERFSPDKEWMPRLVLIAKNTYVWLDQLSKKYRRPLTRLDHIPDEELDTLANRGFNGLWLIGVWERSRASGQIKQWMGNPEAIASAYSLHSYHIANDLGGEDACQDLRQRAGRRGIRLASDMVPNHMGIDSTWVIEHPDWFLSLDYSPYPSYTFNGQDLSTDPRVSIVLEDHYYSRSDAAVVFKHVDHHSGRQRYIYHGNDGTSMPWNDTAQLNYLKAEVREAVIQTILEVARRFSIIRFDAAMTLAKKHYQRLWFPEPGSGGDIPSRSEHGITKEQFDALMPAEFWREVVDRAAVEARDTLLLAEAFWLMEGYFVRSLGMHRVYNSAFMNLLRNEDNAKYRTVMKNTLEFDPEILKRFVNFMSNPDERTAVDQFGKGDKYLGICLMMSTLPGLPMFGHGQIEGYTEKYGMEFRRAYLNEQPDQDLVERHQRHIFPLLHRRALFAGVEHFLLFDFFTSGGGVDENVFAYSNGEGGERSLIVYHNRFGDTRGWIRTSVAFMQRSGDQRRRIQRSLGEGLNLTSDEATYVTCRDHITGLEYLHPSRQICKKGLYLELGAYKAHVFMDFRQVRDDERGSYRQLCRLLDGRGVPSIAEALQALLLEPVQNPLRQIVNRGYFNFLLGARAGTIGQELPAHTLDEAVDKMRQLLHGIQQHTRRAENQEIILAHLRARLETLLNLPRLEKWLTPPRSKNFKLVSSEMQGFLVQEANRWLVLIGWVFLHNIGKINSEEGFEFRTLSWLDEWQYGRVLSNLFLEMGVEEAQSERLISALRLMISQQGWYHRLASLPLKDILENWLADVEVQRFLQINRHQGVLWFNHEAFMELTGWMRLLSALDVPLEEGIQSSSYRQQLLATHEIIEHLRKAEQESDYQVNRLIAAATG